MSDHKIQLGKEWKGTLKRLTVQGRVKGNPPARMYGLISMPTMAKPIIMQTTYQTLEAAQRAAAKLYAQRQRTQGAIAECPLVVALTTLPPQ